ncbi:MAG TPA: hypothetical protein PLW35_02895, partial [Verrucomicrobiota bacterium]|nr:hypothetical protein [Verrucomicrobiota bacterium]
PTPTASAAAREKPSGSAARSNGAIWGQTRSWLGAPQVVLLGAGEKRWGNTISTRKLSVFRVNAEL